MVTINIGRKEMVFFSVVVLVFAVAGVAVSLNSGNYLVHGHDAGEVDVGGGGSPVGTISIYTGSSVPAGYLLCDGSSVSRATYSDLFSVVGTAYGSVDGSTFNVPDLRGRVPVGVDGAAGRISVGGGALGEGGGTETHTLTEAEMPSHTHTVSLRTGNEKVPFDQWGNMDLGGNTGSKGGDDPHNNMQPYQVVNYIIKT